MQSRCSENIGYDITFGLFAHFIAGVCPLGAFETHGKAEPWAFSPLLMRLPKSLQADLHIQQGEVQGRSQCKGVGDIRSREVVESSPLGAIRND